MTEPMRPATGQLRVVLNEEPAAFHTEFVMGTAVTFEVRLDSDQPRLRSDAAGAIRAGAEWLHWVDRVFTTYDAESYVCRLGRGEIGLDDCPVEVADVVRMCREFKERTDGWFDPWAGPDHPFDPSGLVKGWAAQVVSDRLADAGFTRHCVNAGGDVVTRGRPGCDDGWGVGVSHPLEPGRLCAAVTVCDESVATSGTAERGEHVWQPFDHRPADALASVTVVHADLTAADVYATAAFAMGHDAADWLERMDIDGYLVDTNGLEWSTPGFERRRTWPPRDDAS